MIFFIEASEEKSDNSITNKKIKIGTSIFIQVIHFQIYSTLLNLDQILSFNA